MANKLGPGDAFPTMTINLVGGGTTTLPGDLSQNWNLVLFYRGHW